ncbi:MULTISPECIES: SUF system Fe-S cluster assembly regulator [Legionella]|uniref:SUF system Fe-S cluster assembly regulator n=1 Tax=Legionella septentrionalis TaxID=2498109 RepID=A0A433JMH1_9GAMM|nr:MULTISPECIES: SUF system Fe-S cluster assembly regulator [Legionella]MCP0913125.1 SUF system Fe-S cluster assembly regulator [Legionella sp. 27cVA30]RUQ91574.1 SUF system Fe-S cluster assembly regulator [Legionella septentrionalis]RUR02489.1 SUF system Fe-S cluster assembly regulator [Legionella septentrionalis]RUR10624.1 SUF system Fe-S cluster assembly regulator [Legionella septentrionalis]RUR17147.1 SUF system Fe-S cluster assembly regulator [Legionella septentrionalis]
MLRISKLADYGTVVMVYLAKRPQQVCNARDIALHTHLTVPTVSKLLKRLTAAGLLSSVRGVAGGYRLQRPASAISVTEIIYALEESRGLTECSLEPNECSLQGVCHVQGNWRLISQAIESALSSVSLEALAKPALQMINLDRIKQLGSL